jgi:hypothetical protein
MITAKVTKGKFEINAMKGEITVPKAHDQKQVHLQDSWGLPA